MPARVSKVFQVFNNKTVCTLLASKYLHDLVHLHPDDVGRHAHEVDDDEGSHQHHVPQLVPQVRVVEEEGGVRGKLGLVRLKWNS